MDIENKRFLCYQLLHKTHSDGGIEISVVIRNVGADNKNEALGKFISETNIITDYQKLEPFVFPLIDLMKID